MICKNPFNVVLPPKNKFDEISKIPSQRSNNPKSFALSLRIH